MSTESLGHAAKKAAKRAARGVRRTFGIDIARRRAFEWSPALGDWMMLALGERIEDPALAVPVPVAAIVDAAAAELATLKAYRAQRHPEFLAEHDEAKRATLRSQLSFRFGAPAPDHEAAIAAAGTALLDRYLERVVTVATIDQVFERS